jgi:hypothetical protein
MVSNGVTILGRVNNLSVYSKVVAGVMGADSSESPWDYGVDIVDAK